MQFRRSQPSDSIFNGTVKVFNFEPLIINMNDSGWTARASFFSADEQPFSLNITKYYSQIKEIKKPIYQVNNRNVNKSSEK